MFNTISSVDPGSRLEGRVLPGDELRYINRHEIHDVLDYNTGRMTARSRWNSGTPARSASAKKRARISV